MNIMKIAIELLKPAKYNPRKDLKKGDPEYEKLVKSIEEYDYIEPIVWNKTTGNIVSGHQRFKILKDKGLKEIDVVVVEFDETKEKMANIAMNKISGDWDFTSLANLLQELDTGDIDMDLTGFDVKELEKIMTFLPENFILDEKDAFDKLGGEKSGYEQITFTMLSDQMETVKQAIGKSEKTGAGENKNGNALHYICLEFLHGIQSK